MLIIHIDEKNRKIGYNGKPFDQLNEVEKSDFEFLIQAHILNPRNKSFEAKCYAKSSELSKHKEQVIFVHNAINHFPRLTNNKTESKKVSERAPSFINEKQTPTGRKTIRACAFHEINRNGYCRVCHQKVI